MAERSGDDDARELARMGYAQQLLRDMGGFANFAVSFSIISILTGGGDALRARAPVRRPVRDARVGWPLVAVMTGFVALSLAELASAFPTAGALYHWSATLGGRGCGFLTAWMNMLGQFAITAGIDYGLAEFLVAMLGLPVGSGDHARRSTRRCSARTRRSTTSACARSRC